MYNTQIRIHGYEYYTQIKILKWKPDSGGIWSDETHCALFNATVQINVIFDDQSTWSGLWSITVHQNFKMSTLKRKEIIGSKSGLLALLKNAKTFWRIIPQIPFTWNQNGTFVISQNKITHVCPFGSILETILRTLQYRIHCCKSSGFYLPCWYHQ